MHETHTITRAYYTRTRVDTPEFDNVMAAGKSGAIEVYSKSGNVVVSLCLSEEAPQEPVKNCRRKKRQGSLVFRGCWRHDIQVGTSSRCLYVAFAKRKTSLQVV